MFDLLGFQGAPKEEWGSVEHSCLSHVLEHRTGIPLTLRSCIWSSCAAPGCRWSASTSSKQAHFVVRPVAEGVEALVDVYNAGEIVTVEDAEALLKPVVWPWRGEDSI